MQGQDLPVLIFAQSGRFLAQSATQAGYTVWVADCFGDSDCLAVAERWQSLPSFSELTRKEILSALSELTQGQYCTMICGSGIEYCFQVLFPLPPNIQLLGNTSNTIRNIKTPRLFFDLLSQHGLTYPDTQFIPPNGGATWLKKKATGLGGGHIQYSDFYTNHLSTEYYYQHFVSGHSGSCLFLADGYEAQLISINQQYSASNTLYPFLLGRIESPWLLSTSHQNYLYKIINQLTASTSLVGLNSLDFIISEHGELLILEVNPRPSASVELIENSAVLFQQHIEASLGLLPNPNNTLKPRKASLFYHYAIRDYSIPAKMIWPSECHDLPHEGVVIKQNEPICTSRVEFDEHNSAMTLHLLIEQKILKQLSPTT